MRHLAEVMAHNASQEQRIKELEAVVKQQQSQLMELEEELGAVRWILLFVEGIHFLWPHS